MDQWIAIVFVISTLMLFQIRKVIHCVPIVAFQSLILTFIVVLMWGETGGSHLLIVALFTLGVKGIAIPIILYYTIQKTGIERRVERITSKYISFLIALALSLFGFYVPSHLHLPQSVPNEVFLPVSIILVLLGTFSMIDHKKAIMQGVGLIILENGLFLLSESMSHGMPLLVELGIFFDVLVTVVVIGILSFRIHSTFGSLNTERMQNLKG